MNRFRKTVQEETPRRFNVFALQRVHIRFPGWDRPFRVLFAQWTQRNADRVEIVFYAIHIEGFIAYDGRASRQVELLPLQRAGVVVGTGHEEKFNGLPSGSDDEMEAEAVEIAAFAGNIAPIRFASVAPGSLNADIVTTGDRKAIDDVGGVGIQLHPVVTEHRKQRQKQVFDAVQAPDKSTRAEHAAHVLVLVEEGTRTRIIAPKEQRGNERDRHNLRVGQVALGIIPVVQCGQGVST